MAIFGNTVAQQSPYRIFHRSDPPNWPHLAWVEKIIPPANGRITKVYVYCSDATSTHKQTLSVQFFASEGVPIVPAFASITVPALGGWAWRSAIINVAPKYISVVKDQLYYVQISQSAPDDAYRTKVAYKETPINNQAMYRWDWSPFTYTGTFCMYFEYDKAGPEEGEVLVFDKIGSAPVTSINKIRGIEKTELGTLIDIPPSHE